MEPKLFKASFNERAEEFKLYLPVNINLRYETVASHIALCEETYIRPLLGNELFGRLVAFYDSETDVADNNEETVSASGSESTTDEACEDKVLLEKVRFALVRLAIWKGYDIISANISDVGVSAEVDKENRLYRYQEENIKKSLKNEGFDYLDNVLEYLEENSGVFPEFASSGYMLDSKQTLIRNTRLFHDCYNIGGSRLVFLKMRQYIRDVELIELQHRVGVSFYQELLTADETEEKWKSILPYIRLYVVYSAVAAGIGELHKIPTDKGLLFETTTMEGVQETPVYRAQVQETRMNLLQKADQYLSAAIHTIKLHPDDYPDYIGFAGDSPEDGIIRRDNTNKKTFLA